MASGEQERLQYLDIAYDLVDGSPTRSFSVQDVEQKLGLDDDRARSMRRDLLNTGLLADEGGGEQLRLRLPAIHRVEEVRLEEGRQDAVDERREQRGSYLRVLHELADGDTRTEVELDELREELDMDMTVEQRTREYLAEAELIAETDDDGVTITATGADWVESA